MKTLNLKEMEMIEGGKLTASCYLGIGLSVAGTLALGFATGGVGAFAFAFGMSHAGWVVTAMGCAVH